MVESSLETVYMIYLVMQGNNMGDPPITRTLQIAFTSRYRAKKWADKHVDPVWHVRIREVPVNP